MITRTPVPAGRGFFVARVQGSGEPCTGPHSNTRPAPVRRTARRSRIACPVGVSGLSRGAALDAVLGPARTGSSLSVRPVLGGAVRAGQGPFSSLSVYRGGHAADLEGEG